MNELQPFSNPEFGTIRTIVKNNEVWFIGKDVAEALGYGNPRQALASHVDVDDRNTVQNLDAIGRKKEMTIINESGLYSLVLSSKLPNAKKFKRWVTSEVLPSIRKHGMYATAQTIENILADPDNAIKIFTVLKEEREKRIAYQNKIEADKPKVVFADAVTTSKNSILVGELAKLIKQNGYDIGQNRLFVYLRENGYLIKRKGTDYNMPTQKSMNLGLFEIKERTVNHTDHSEIVKTPKVTGKGQVYFVNLFMSKKVVK